MMDQHRATSDERHREIARSQGFTDMQMQVLEIYLSLTHEERAEARIMLEERFGRSAGQKAA